MPEIPQDVLDEAQKKANETGECQEIVYYLDACNGSVRWGVVTQGEWSNRYNVHLVVCPEMEELIPAPQVFVEQEQLA